MPSIGIDIGKTNVKAVLLNQHGEVTGRVEAPTPAGAGIVDEVSEIARKLSRQAPSSPTALGLSAPGLASPDLLSICNLPGGQPEIEGINWTKQLDRQNRVPILNDANAALYAESCIGAASGYQHVMLLTLGTGVGGAVMMNGQLIHGRTGKAGHLGHISIHPDWEKSILGVPGSLEYAFGDWSVSQRTQGRHDTTKALVEAHLNGDEQASRDWHTAIGHLARGIVSLTNVLDPEVVVIGGGVTKAGDALFEPLRNEVAKIEWCPTGERVPIVSATLGADAGAIGAALYAKSIIESEAAS